MKFLLLLTGNLFFQYAVGQDSSFFKNIDSIVNSLIKEGHSGKLKMDMDSIIILRNNEPVVTVVESFTDIQTHQLKGFLYAVPALSGTSEDITIYFIDKGSLVQVAMDLDAEWKPKRKLYILGNAAYEYANEKVRAVDAGIFLDNYKSYLERFNKKKLSTNLQP